MFALLTSVVMAATPFAPLPSQILASADVRAALAGGDLVVARPLKQGHKRAFTGLALVPRPCDDLHRILRDPMQYPKIYPMVERTRVLRTKAGRTDFEMVITAGPGSSTRELSIQELPGRVLHTEQEAGHSTWHFFDVGDKACIAHFSHDEDFTSDSLMLRMAMSGKEPIVEGIKSAAAVGNVRNVRSHFSAGQPVVVVAPEIIERALARLSGVGTTAFLAHGAGAPVLVATRVSQPAAQVLDVAKHSERWNTAIPMFSATVGAARADRSRRMNYTLTSLFEDIEFESVQESGPVQVEERIVGGDLQTGGWTWRVVTQTTDQALLLSMRLHIEEGDWLVSQITRYDRTAQEGTVLGIAFMLVEKVVVLANAPARPAESKP
ncbi:MAG: hypothetical protein ABIJ09_21780 [Pseudomonadota bacterium]